MPKEQSSPCPIAPAICVAAGLLLGAASLAAQGPLPGDVAITRLLQDLFGAAPEWAVALTVTAKLPWLWIALGVALTLAVLHTGWRALPGPPSALLLAHGTDLVARSVLFAPRPLADLVAVAAPSASSGLPSTFGLVYGALFGATLCTLPRRSRARAVAVFAVLLMFAGAAARIVLGGHWPSQVIASLLIGIALAGMTAVALGLCRRSG